MKSGGKTKDKDKGKDRDDGKRRDKHRDKDRDRDRDRDRKHSDKGGSSGRDGSSRHYPCMCICRCHGRTTTMYGSCSNCRAGIHREQVPLLPTYSRLNCVVADYG